MYRITMKDLERLCRDINLETNSPLESYTKGENGKFNVNVGNYHLEGAYSGWNLVRMHEKGGTSNPIRGGYYTKRELYDMMYAYLSGIREGRKP